MKMVEARILRREIRMLAEQVSSNHHQRNSCHCTAVEIRLDMKECQVTPCVYQPCCNVSLWTWCILQHPRLMTKSWTASQKTKRSLSMMEE